jgi:hypothetical protein
MAMPLTPATAPRRFADVGDVAIAGQRRAVTHQQVGRAAVRRGGEGGGVIDARGVSRKVETQALATVLLYGAWLQSTFCSGMLNWSESGTGWMTVRILFLL